MAQRILERIRYFQKCIISRRSLLRSINQCCIATLEGTGTRTVRRSHRTLLGDFSIGGLKALSDAEDTFLNLATGGAAEIALVQNAVIRKKGVIPL